MSSSSTLTQLINLLTRPLIFTHPAITIVQLQLALQTNLSILFNTQAFAPFTLHLSPNTLPIPPIYAACLSLGLNWEQWVVALSGGKDLYMLVMQGCIKVGVLGTKETVVVWEEKELETKPSTASKLQAMLDSARARKQANANAQASTHSHTLPTLRITPSTPSVTSSPSEPSSPVSATPSSSSSANSDLDSDSDSDTESTFSSQSSHSSQSSVSSISSNSTKPCSNALGTPFTTKPISRAQRRREWVAQTQASARALNANINPNAHPSAKANAEITKYTYQGGQTGVMTGGVMLGGRGVVTTTTTGTVTDTTTMNRRSLGSGSGSGSANWRRDSRRI